MVQLGKHQGMAKTKFELSDLDLIFEVTEFKATVYERCFCSIPGELFDVSSQKFVTQRHQGQAGTRIEHHDLVLLFTVTKVI